MSFGHVRERKRASDTWVIEKFKEDTARHGYQDVILKGNVEPTMVQVLEMLNLPEKPFSPSFPLPPLTIIQHSPAYETQANCAEDYMGQVRAMKIGLGARLKCKVASDWKVME